MIVRDQFYVPGRGVVVTGKLDDGEPWPRLEIVPAKMPDGSMIALDIRGIESHKILTDPPILKRDVGLCLKGIDKDFNLIGADVMLERRHRDRRKK